MQKFGLAAPLAKALEIHLCYIYRSIVPRIYGESYGEYVPADLRADYVALLKLDPMQGSWGETKPGITHNLSQPLPPTNDGR
jgi:hypothetical protein